MRNLLLIFFTFLQTTAATAQQNTAANQAKIWHKALTWIYEDNNKTQGKTDQKPVPQASAKSLEQFEKDLAAASKKQQDAYNFYSRLYQPVQQKLAKTKPVTNEVLINAIVAEAGKPGRDADQFRLALETAANPGTTTATPEENPETTSIQPEPEPENLTAPTVASEIEKPVQDENKLPMYLSILALLLAAFALWRASQKNSRSAAPTQPENAMPASVKNTSENSNVKALKREIQTLKNELHQLKTENENWRAYVQQAIQNLQAESFAKPPVSENYTAFNEQFSTPNQTEIATQNARESYPETPAENQPYIVETDHLFAEETPLQNLVKYTRVPEDGQLKERDLHYDSRDTWSFIEVTLPENGSNSARFRINPHVNHALAINNSLDRLENAFEFARSANKATQLVNVADGELTRTAQGWQITKRAKIHLA